MKRHTSGILGLIQGYGHRAVRLALVAIWLCGFLFAVPPPAQAAWVSSTEDVVADDGVCTLREAITAANTNTASGSTFGECAAGIAGPSSPDMISLAPGTYTLSIAGVHENANASGDLDITERLIITGAGAERTIIDADSIDRVMEVHIGVNLILEDLTITGGAAPKGADSIGFGGASGSPGGGIHNQGALTLRRCVVHHNRAGQGGNGTVNGSDYGGHGGGGGGMSSEGSLTLEDTAVHHNYAGCGGNGGTYNGDGGDGGNGGGLNLSGDATITRCSIHANQTGMGGSFGSSTWGGSGSPGDGGFGGGMSLSGSVDIADTTVSGNTTGNGFGGDRGFGGFGGGISNWGGVLTLAHVTLVDNVTGTGLHPGSGGGLYGTSSSTNNVKNTLLAANRLGAGSGGSGPDCYVYTGSINSQGYNIIEDPTDCTITGDTTGNQLHTDPDLFYLADNGGFTPTHAPGPSSCALDHIPNGTNGCGGAFTSDQRGKPRPGGAACDVGAFELQADESIGQGSNFIEGQTVAFALQLAAVKRNVGSDDPGTVVVNRQTAAPDYRADYRPIPALWHLTASGDSYDLDLELCYTDDEASGLDQTALDIYRWDAAQGVWVNKDGTLDAADNCITATGVTSFSTWMLAALRTPIYVDADATGTYTGLSWTDAFTDLQAALSGAVYDDEIWVAEGTYKPTDGADRSASFTMVPGVEIYGGFAGTEVDRDQRDWVTHVVTLSGDIGAIGGISDNSYHVVVGSGVTETAALDGFVITEGNAGGSDPNDRGGGIYVSAGDPVIRNCAIEGNRASYWGGGMTVEDAGTPVVVDTTFIGNHAAAYGGGLASLSASPAQIINVRFLGNTGTYGGGGAVSWQSNTRYNNALFSGNRSNSGGGGGLYNWSANAELRGVTVSRNYAYSNGGGIMNSGGGPSVANSVFWDNSVTYGAAEIHNTMGNAAVSYSIVKGGYSGTGNLSGDPLFIDADGADDVAGTLDDDLVLNNGSPAIDAGSNTAVPADVADLDGDADTGEATPYDLGRELRFFDHPTLDSGEGTPPIVDMGAYEKQRSCWARLNDDPTDYRTVQAAVDAGSSPADIVKVAGTCGGVWSRAGFTQTLLITKTLTVRGGYTKTFAGPLDPVAYPTTLNAGGGGRVVLVRGSVSPVIEGLHITGGDAAGLGGAGPNDGGGGVAVFTATATISNCWIYSNTAETGGGVLLGGSGTLIRNEIYENTADNDGAGVATGMCDVTLTRNHIHDNRSLDVGGGLSLFRTDGTIADNTIAENEAVAGGGLYLEESGPTISGNDILSNTVGAGGGGGLYLVDSGATVISNTVRANIADDGANGSGGGIKVEGSDSDGATIRYNEIAENQSHWVGAGVFVNDSAATVTDNWIHHNEGNEGSGVTVEYGQPMIAGNTLEHNWAGWRGGAVLYQNGAGGQLAANIIRDNDAKWEAGAILVRQSTPTLVNNVILNNDLTSGGTGGVVVISSTLQAEHNTIVANDGGDGCGVFVQFGGSAVTLTNTIVASQTTGISVDGGSVLQVDGVLWYGNDANVAGDGTITVTQALTGTPAFAADGVHILTTSAAIDAGVAVSVTCDIDGDVRPVNHGYDLGADELTVDLVKPTLDVHSPATAAGDVPITAAIVMTFSEAIDTGTLAVTVTPDPGGWTESWREGDTVVTLSHADFTPDTTYTVTVTAAYDLAGNFLDGAPLVWSFSTPARPLLLSYAPAAGAADVPLDATVVLTFSKAINTVTLDVTIAPDPGGWSESWRGGDTVVAMSHADFAGDTVYTMTVCAAECIHGTPLTGAPVRWAFVTETAGYTTYLPLVLRTP